MSKGEGDVEMADDGEEGDEGDDEDMDEEEAIARAIAMSMEETQQEGKQGEKKS
jgi:26S proteasome regulatory subunit N10